MLDRLKRLIGNAEGQVTILFALASVPMLIGAGAAIDYVRAYNVRTEMQAAVDGAALAAAVAQDLSTKERQTLAISYFKSNFSEAQKIDVTLSVKVTAKSVDASASYSLPMSLMSLAGIKTSEITVNSEVQRMGESWAEVVLVLDYSGSMRDNDKYIRMSKAASDMVTSLSTSIGIDKLKVGLVPFSAMVSTSMPAKYVSQTASGATWTGCTQDRNYPYNTTVDTPKVSDTATQWGYIETSNQTSGDRSCPYYAQKKLTILPLTADVDAVKSQLSVMQPLGHTNISLGAEFGWNLLDPAQPFTEGAAYANKKNHKYLILLTDGMQTTPEWGSGGSRSVANAQANLATLCDGMAKAGITVFSVAYDVTDPAITTLLKKCGGDHYYEPDVSESNITQVFTDITKEIGKQTIRLAR